MDEVTALEITALGFKGYPHTRCKLPEHLVRDIPALLRDARVLNPAVDADALFRTIVRLGCEQVRRNNERRVPVRTADLPHARTTVGRTEPKDTSVQDSVSGLNPSRS